jgi:hypothetical protein
VYLLSLSDVLVRRPNKFKKLIWVKRGDYLIASTAAPETETQTETQAETETAPVPVPASVSVGDMKVQYLIKSILTKEQIAHIEKAGLW